MNTEKILKKSFSLQLLVQIEPSVFFEHGYVCIFAMYAEKTFCLV